MGKANQQILNRYEAGFQRDVWGVFKVMGEFVDGYQKMSSLGPSVSFFGSARLNEESPYYEMAVETAKLLSEKGFGIITGGGPGIMEAGNKGARLAEGISVGLCIELPFEQTTNSYVDRDHAIEFNYFFARKVMFVKYAQGFVVMPGGLGTLDELFEALTLIQTMKIDRFPIVLMGSEFWDGLICWMKDTLVAGKTISAEDMDLFQVSDDPAETAQIIHRFYQKNTLGPNF